jgi:hypothetical protein
MGHKSEALIKKTLETIGCKVTGTLASCEGCAFAKAKQRAVSKTTSTRAIEPGQRVFLDMSGPFEATTLGNKYTIQVVDDFSRFGLVTFRKKSNDMPKWAREAVFMKFKNMGYKIEYLRCDNEGENKKPLEGFCNEYGAILELTAPDTPQQNGVVERRIVILQQCANAMLIVANFTKEARSTLWAEAVNMANDLENITANTSKKISPYKLFSTKESKLYSKLIEFGHLGYVTIQRKFSAKWKKKSCPECGDNGPIYNYCFNCEDSGMIYDAIPLTGDIPSTSSNDDREGNQEGTCPECNRSGRAGDSCSHCQDSILLNFQAGL